MLCELRDEPTVELLQFSVQIRYPEPVIAPKVGQRPISPYAEQVSLRLNRFFPLLAYFTERTAGFIIRLLLGFAEYQVILRQAGIRLDLNLLQFIE